MNNKNNFYIEKFSNSPYRHRYYINEIQPRRDSYQMAIHISKQDHSEFLYSSSSSISSINDHINTTQSLYTIHNGCSYCINEHIQRSISQPVVRLQDNDYLLENATFLLDSPVHALRPTHHKSPEILSQTQSSLTANESLNENTKYSHSSNISINSIYRIVFLRSFASVLALASLFTIEVLQTSIYSIEHSFQSLLTLHLSSSITALIFSIHSSHIQITRHRWKISNVLAYDRCSKILIIFSTIFTSIWIIMQYFYFFYYFLLITASISGISLTCMIIKTFDHLLQLSTSLSMDNMKILIKHFNIFIFIYNSICHLSLTIGGICLLGIILYQQSKYKYILIGSQSCFLIPGLKLNNQLNDKTLLKSIPINLTMYLTDNKQIWINNPTRYIYYLSLIFLTIISLIIQACTKWTTSIMSMSRQLSILYYRLNDLSKNIYYRHYLFALFIGFQEGYVFGNILKFDITCLFGLRHTIEMLIIYGLGATISSILFALISKRITIKTSVSFTTLLHSLTIILLYLIQAQNGIFNLQPLTLRYILFFSYGIVLGLWSTIAIHSICNSTKLSSSSTFAQSLGLRYIGRLIAYICILFLCQSFLFYINLISLLCIFSFTFICYCCCNQ